MKIIHIADVHWRGLTRHDEYKIVFSKFFERAKEVKPDAIVIAGDIWHTKTQGITPEAIDAIVWWLSEMSKVCHVYVTLGNHDGVLHNKTRQDAISPIIFAMCNSNITLIKNSCVYKSHMPNTYFGVFSCFDEEGWVNVKPVANATNIAIFHGGVVGSQTDSNWDISGHVDISFFEGFDFVMLGDIHKTQFLDMRMSEIEIDEDDLWKYPDAHIIGERNE